MKLKFIPLLAVLFALAGLSMAQNCTLVTCHVDQRSPVRVVAENGQYSCVFTQSEPEAVQAACYTGQTLKITTKFVFFLGECIGSNFTGANIIQWSLCRTGESTFSWDISAGILEKTGTLF